MDKSQIKSPPLLTAPIPGMMRRIAIPVSIGAFFNTMFNVVDTVYGGAISDQALAALSLSFPIFFIIVALGFGFSQGITALIGNALGRGDRELAQRYAIQGGVYGVFLSIITTGVVISIAPALVTFMGATDEVYRQMALAYINPIFYGTIFFLTVQMLSAILNALGDTIPGRNFLMAGFVLNLLLDPWFIFGGFGLPAMGITGIALATVFVQFLGCLYIGYVVAQTGFLSQDNLRQFWKPSLSIFGNITRQGLPNTVDMMGLTLGFFIVTVFVSRFGQEAVAAMGAASRIEQLFLLPMLGLNIAVLSLVAQNNGAGRIDRVWATYRLSLWYGSLVMFVTMLLAIALARPIMWLFTADETIIQIGVEYARIRSLGFIPNAIFFMAASAMRGIERPMPALVLNFVRFVLLPWLLIAIFVQGLGYGLTSIWVSTTIAFFLAAIASMIMAQKILPQEQT